MSLPASLPSPLWSSDAILSQWFEDAATPLEVDFGCHRGAFLLGIAALHPECRFLGIERQPTRVQKCLGRIRRNERLNAHAVEGTGSAALTQWLPDASVSTLHVSFPDPWPKRKHAMRRLVNSEFLKQCHRVLQPHGILRMMTDDTAYFHEMVALTNKIWQQIPWHSPPDQPLTAFERRFESQGQIPHRLALRRA